MFSNPDETAVKLHTDNIGHVWYAKGIGPATNSAQIVDEFMLSPILAGMGLCVRVLGTPQNAELIAALYLRRHKNEIRALEVAGPQVVLATKTTDPREAIIQMRGLALAPACGGWHLISMMDYPTYAMLARMLRTNFVFDESVNTYYHLHPAYRALSFIPGLSLEEVAKLLTTIIDPRWYVDLRMPERTSKLELYLGLTPKIQRRVSDKSQILKRVRELRCANVLSCWKTAESDSVDLTAPANFLYRVYRNAGGGAKGDLRASQAFVRYLRHNWLAGLENRNGVKDGLFAPDLFFKSPAEIESYSRHMATAKLA